MVKQLSKCSNPEFPDIFQMEQKYETSLDIAEAIAEYRQSN